MDTLILFLVISSLISCVVPLCSAIYLTIKSGRNTAISEETAIYLTIWLVSILIPIVNIVVGILFTIKLLKELNN